MHEITSEWETEPTLGVVMKIKDTLNGKSGRFFRQRDCVSISIIRVYSDMGR